jgi:hypothetical protein
LERSLNQEIIIMTIVKSKYRGTKAYFLAFSELITAARYHGVVNYQRIAHVTGLPERGNAMGKELGQLLGEISEDETCRGRPMLSTLAVSVTTGKPSAHFYDYARALGKLKSEVKEDELAFWERECKALYETWKMEAWRKKGD